MTERKETPKEIAARVRKALPGYLKRPQGEVKADKAAMKLRAASFTRARLTEEERVIAEGAKLEAIARANIELQEGLRSEGHNVSTRGGANLEMLGQERFRLAQGLELQGRYEEAATAHPHKRERARLLKVVEAIAKPDGDHCKCPADTADVPGKIGEPHYEVKRIYSRPHRRMVSLVGCRKCPGLNATPTPPEALAKTLAAVNGSQRTGAAQMRRARR